MRLIASLFCFGNFQISISWQQECILFIAVQRNSGPKPSDFQSWAVLHDFCQGSLNSIFFWGHQSMQIYRQCLDW